MLEKPSETTLSSTPATHSPMRSLKGSARLSTMASSSTSQFNGECGGTVGARREKVPLLIGGRAQNRSVNGMMNDE